MSTFEEAFCGAEENALAFLVRDYGFHATERKVTEGASSHSVFAFVRYVHKSRHGDQGASSKYVTLSIAPLRLELDLVISGDVNRSYTIEELHSLLGNTSFPPRQHDLCEAMYDERQLLEEFTRLAGILRACGGRFFSGDASLWSELEAQRRERAQSEEDKRALLLSEEAFHRQNWQHVVSILEPMAARLSKAATARLSYAKKKLKNTT